VNVSKTAIFGNPGLHLMPVETEGDKSTEQGAGAGQKLSQEGEETLVEQGAGAGKSKEGEMMDESEVNGKGGISSTSKSSTSKPSPDIEAKQILPPPDVNPKEGGDVEGNDESFNEAEEDDFGGDRADEHIGDTGVRHKKVDNDNMEDDLKYNLQDDGDDDMNPNGDVPIPAEGQRIDGLEDLANSLNKEDDDLMEDKKQ